MYPQFAPCERQLEAVSTTDTINIELASEQATVALAATLSRIARAGDVIALKGDLGVGKSVFARAFIRARCGAQTEVPSPTFTLLQPYDTTDQTTLFHFDLYRLETPEDALQLDIDNAFYSGISLIEWPERLGALLPREHLQVALSYGDAEKQRHCALSGSQEWAGRLSGVSL